MEKEKKDSYWFTHDADAAGDPKIIALIGVYGFEGYGRWWRILEWLRTQSEYKYDVTTKFAYPSLADALKLNVSETIKLVNDLIKEFDLLKTDDTYIWSDSLINRMAKWDNKKETLKERGTNGANARWKKKKEEEAKRGDTPPEELENIITCSKVYNKLANEYKKGGKHSIEHLNSYVNFIEWMKKNAERVLSMKTPITIDEYIKLVKKYPLEKFDVVKDMLKKMHNYRDLYKNMCVYLTLLNWLKRDSKDTSTAIVGDTYTDDRAKREAETKRLEDDL